MMPDGATTRDLLDTQKVRHIISSNAQGWYKYARNTRGRVVGNGEIRLVIGVDKVSSWGIATSACSTGQTASYVFKHDPTHLYRWDCIGGSGRVGPQKREIGDLVENNILPENQSIFIRTINFTLSGKMWNDIPSNGIQQSGSFERPSGPDSFGNPDASGGPGPSSGSSSTEGRGISSSGSGNTFSASSHRIGTTQASLFDFPCVLFDPVERGVSLASLSWWLLMNMIQATHPSAAMHDRLHGMVTILSDVFMRDRRLCRLQFPDADLVITEDMDWISVLHDVCQIIAGTFFFFLLKTC